MMMGTTGTAALCVVCRRYTLAVLMSTVVERQSFTLEFDSVASSSGYFAIKIGSSDATVAIPHDAVSRTYNIGVRWRLSSVQGSRTFDWSAISKALGYSLDRRR